MDAVGSPDGDFAVYSVLVCVGDGAFGGARSAQSENGGECV